MKRLVHHIIRGCGTLPHCGEHPGTGFLFGFVAMGAIAGARGGLLGIVTGAGVMLAFFGPVYLFGAYGRSVDDERMSQRDPAHDRSDPSR